MKNNTNGIIQDSKEEFSELIDQIGSAIGQTSELVLRWGKKAFVHLEAQQLHQEKVAESFIRAGKQLERIESNLEKTQTRIDAQREQISRLSAQIFQLSSRQHTLEHNLEQIRILCEGMVRKLEQLTDDFIEHHVTDPLFKEFTRIYGSLCSIESDGKFSVGDEVKALAEGVARFLESHGIKIIQPEEGEIFDPRQHQPIKSRDTTDRKSNGRIACTYHVGLSGKGRIIQPARVKVFTFNKEESHKNQTYEGEQEK